jgi:hypothetical protein
MAWRTCECIVVIIRLMLIRSIKFYSVQTYSESGKFSMHKPHAWVSTSSNSPPLLFSEPKHYSIRLSVCLTVFVALQQIPCVWSNFMKRDRLL